MIIAVDTGGTKTLVGRFTRRGGLQETIKFPTPKDQGDFLEKLHEAIRTIANDAQIECISIALPGRIRQGIMFKVGTVQWNNFDVRPSLQDAFSCPVIVENDANLAAIAEIRSLKHLPHIGMYVTVSTGIGTGLIIDGDLHQPLSESEGGQILLEHDGTFIEWEKFASGKAIFTKYGKFASEISNTRHWHEIAKNIARGLMVIAPLMRTEVIVIGGSIGTHFEHYGDYLQRLLQESLHPDNVPLILQAKHPEEAVIYGCYHYANDFITRTTA